MVTCKINGDRLHRLQRPTRGIKRRDVFRRLLPEKQDLRRREIMVDVIPIAKRSGRLNIARGQ